MPCSGGGTRSFLDLMCHAFFKPMGGLILSEWRRRRRRQDGVGAVRGREDDERKEGTLRLVCKINGKILTK